METQVINATEYRNVPLALLNESKTNPRQSSTKNMPRDPPLPHASNGPCRWKQVVKTPSADLQLCDMRADGPRTGGSPAR